MIAVGAVRDQHHLLGEDEFLVGGDDVSLHGEYRGDGGPACARPDALVPQLVRI